MPPVYHEDLASSAGEPGASLCHRQSTGLNWLSLKHGGNAFDPLSVVVEENKQILNSKQYWEVKGAYELNRGKQAETVKWLACEFLHGPQ